MLCEGSPPASQCFGSLHKKFGIGLLRWYVIAEDWIDEWGGWWLYRWGDAAIRGVQAWIMLEALCCFSPKSCAKQPIDY